MYCFKTYAFFFIIRFIPSAGIVLKENTYPYTDPLIPVTYSHLPKRNLSVQIRDVEKNIRGYKIYDESKKSNLISKSVNKILNSSTALPTSLNQELENYNIISRKIIHDFSQPDEYVSYQKGDQKPTYEESESDIGSNQNNHKPIGYYYNIPTPRHLQLYTDKSKITNIHTVSENLTAAIKILDRFLTPLNDGSYNSALHLPVNPLLALILSRYGRYIPGNLNSRLYSYMAINNIHNNKPFGQYKYELNEDSVTTK